MDFYSDVTKVRMITSVRRNRILPRSGEVVVPVGQEVKPVHILARATDVTSYQILRAADLIGVSTEKLNDFLLVKEGDSLKRGTPLIRKPGLFGRAKIFRSPVEGLLRQVRDGCLVMERAGGHIELRAIMPGRVVSIIAGRGVVLETIATQIEGIWDSGKEGFGRLSLGTEYNNMELETNRLTSVVHGSVIVAGKISDIESLEALEELGVRGLIVGGFPSYLYHKASNFSYPIIATDGIGDHIMAKPIFDLFKQSEGRQASILSGNGGPRRQKSEVVIPMPSAHDIGQLENTQISLAVGSQVRVRRLENKNIGKIVRTYDQPQKTLVGALLPGADVEFADSEIRFIPYRNIDLLS